jgi:DNA-binding transcriptional MerR regulator
MWEQRYKALVPQRSAGNTRYYDDQQLIRLLNIVTVSQQGLKISQICSLSDEAMHQLLDREIAYTAGQSKQHEFYISQLLTHGLAYNEAAFGNLLSKCTARYGLRDTYVKIIYPLLVRLGLMWQKEFMCAAQEHFLTNIIRQKIFAAINDLPVLQDDYPLWLLFLPEEEEHEAGLLLSSYILRESGQKVIYLGGRVPMDSLKQAMEANPVNHLLLFMTQYRKHTETQAYIDTLSSAFANTPIYLAGNQRLIEELHLPSNVSWLKSLEELEAILQPQAC